MRGIFSAIIAIVAGVITLLGLFIPASILQDLRILFIDWAILLAGVAGLVAIIHLMKVHWRKLFVAEEKDISSAYVLVAFVITVVAGLYLKPSHPGMQKVVTHIQVPIEASLMGVLSISLIVASIRFFQRRRGLMAVVFAASAVVFLILASGILAGMADIPILKDILAALNALPVAGARGILLGVALGSLTTGLRILLGSDRPYTG